MSNEQSMHATTIVTVRKGGKVVIAGDGQVSLGQTIMKGNARKVRRIGKGGGVIAGFAGATADAFTADFLGQARTLRRLERLRAGDFAQAGPPPEAAARISGQASLQDALDRMLATGATQLAVEDGTITLDAVRAAARIDPQASGA